MRQRPPTTTNGLAGGDAAATADPDNDGLDNAVEFVIGGQPNPANANANSSGIAPTVSTDANNLIFTFRRTDLALTQPGIGITVEYGSDLSGWATATHAKDISQLGFKTDAHKRRRKPNVPHSIEQRLDRLKFSG